MDKKQSNSDLTLKTNNINSFITEDLDSTGKDSYLNFYSSLSGLMAVIYQYHYMKLNNVFSHNKKLFIVTPILTGIFSFGMTRLILKNLYNM